MEHHDQKRHIYVDAKRHEIDGRTITGAQVKVLAQIPPNYQVFLEEEGDKPDRQVGDADPIELGEGEQTRHFYAVPPATFGSR